MRNKKRKKSRQDIKFMLKWNIFVFIIIIFLIFLECTIGLYLFTKGDEKMIEDGGVVKNIKLKGYNDKIVSKDIVSFKYQGYDFFVSCELKDNTLHVTSRGSLRDDSYFALDYNSKDNKLLNDLQDIVVKYNLSKNNGYEYEVAGLPEGLGDILSVKYESGEKIWKYCNQAHNVTEEVANKIYDVFHNCALRNDLDFNHESSDIVLNDDATKEYVQGTWKGIHFGREYKIIFDDDNIKIYEDNKLTDDIEYLIINGDIVTNKVKVGIDTPKDRDDYEEFSVISTIKKKNDFTMVAYFMKDSYSTCNLLRQE